MSRDPQILPLDLDIDQWLRDIATFIETTNQELAEITDQLSCQLADPQSRKNSGSMKRNSKNTKTFPKTSDERLAKLKQKLAAKAES